MYTLSPITHNNGSYTFTLNGEKYWTNENGQGLWCNTNNGTRWADTKEAVLEPTQILGTTQLDLNTSNRRAKVLHWYLHSSEGTQDFTDYSRFLHQEQLKDSFKATQLFDRNQK